MFHATVDLCVGLLTCWFGDTMHSGLCYNGSPLSTIHQNVAACQADVQVTAYKYRLSIARLHFVDVKVQVELKHY